MGLFDVIEYGCECPYCEEYITTRGQTKNLKRSMKVYRRGEELPLLNHTYLLAVSGMCPQCNQEFYSVLEVRDRKLGCVLETINPKDLPDELKDEVSPRILSTLEIFDLDWKQNQYLTQF